MKKENMKPVDFLGKRRQRFVTASAFTTTLDIQVQMAPIPFEAVKKFDAMPAATQSLEFFFYTNTRKKAMRLAAALKQLAYTVRYAISSPNKKLFVVSGCTPQMEMTDDVMSRWIRKMCETGYRFDCAFDGWGTLLILDADADNDD